MWPLKSSYTFTKNCPAKFLSLFKQCWYLLPIILMSFVSKYIMYLECSEERLHISRYWYIAIHIYKYISFSFLSIKDVLLNVFYMGLLFYNLKGRNGRRRMNSWLIHIIHRQNKIIIVISFCFIQNVPKLTKLNICCDF